jgi:hypothetical protein
MKTIRAIVMVLLSCVLTDAHAQAERIGGSNRVREVAGVKITLAELEVSNDILKLRYEIKNESSRDVWLCESIPQRSEFEVYFAEDGETLVIRRRLDVSTGIGWVVLPIGTYGRLRPAQSRIESLQSRLPVQSAQTFYGREPVGRNTVYASKLAVELGFYDCDVPSMVLDMLDKAERTGHTQRDDELLGALGGSLMFTLSNEPIRDRDRTVDLSWNYQSVKAEQVLRIVAEDVNIPYASSLGMLGTEVSPFPKPPDLGNCTRVTVTYEPSMLDYFFPSASQQSLLMNSEEREYLGRQKAIVVENAQQIKVLSDEIRRARSGGIVATGSSAHVVCYQGDKVLASFTLYGDHGFIMEGAQQFFTYTWARIESPRAFAEPAQPFEQRANCAANLKNLWYRLRLSYRAQRAALTDSLRTPKYPAGAEWCDSIVLAFERAGSRPEVMKPFKCPVVAEGRSHYAMNPNCSYDSGPDVVLLFEAKAGWNQHGGPELFTFDNHDPKGGLVLLNDGTVKFIRSEEELKQLRW